MSSFTTRQEERIETEKWVQILLSFNYLTTKEQKILIQQKRNEKITIISALSDPRVVRKFGDIKVKETIFLLQDIDPKKLSTSKYMNKAKRTIIDDGKKGPEVDNKVNNKNITGTKEGDPNLTKTTEPPIVIDNENKGVSSPGDENLHQTASRASAGGWFGSAIFAVEEVEKARKQAQQAPPPSEPLFSGTGRSMKRTGAQQLGAMFGQANDMSIRDEYQEEQDTKRFYIAVLIGVVGLSLVLFDKK